MHAVKKWAVLLLSAVLLLCQGSAAYAALPLHAEGNMESEVTEEGTEAFDAQSEAASGGAEITQEAEALESSEADMQEADSLEKGEEAAEAAEALEEAEAAEEGWIAASPSQVDQLVGMGSAGRTRAVNSQTIVNAGEHRYDGAASPMLVSGQTNQPIFCILSWSKVPGGSIAFNDYNITENSDANLQLMAKIMYYGYGGGGNYLTGYSAADQNAITHFALAYIWMSVLGHHYEDSAGSWIRSGDGNLGPNGQAAVMDFVNRCRSADPVEGTLHIAECYTASGHTFQDLAYGDFTVISTSKMDPIGTLLKKVDAKTGNDVRHVG